MANHSNFVKIVIFVAFFFVLLFKGTKHKHNEKHSATRAQFCATRAQFEKVVHFAQIHQQDHLLFFNATTFLWSVIKLVETTTFQFVFFFLVQMDVQVHTIYIYILYIYTHHMYHIYICPLTTGTVPQVRLSLIQEHHGSSEIIPLLLCISLFHSEHMNYTGWGTIKLYEIIYETKWKSQTDFYLKQRFVLSLVFLDLPPFYQHQITLKSLYY